MGHADEIFNRTDCPYGCGTPLPPNLRWQATPCRGCGRPLHPLSAVLDDDGQEIWPPATVPRPAMPVPVGATVWYVVGEEEAREGRATGRTEVQRRVAKSESSPLAIIGTALGFAVIGVADAIRRVVKAVLRR